MGNAGRNRTVILIVAIALLCVVGIVGGVLAYKSSHKENQTKKDLTGSGSTTKTETSTGSPVSTSPVSDSVPKVENIPLMQGTPFATTVYAISSGRKSTNTPVVFIFAGVHGDEQVGYMAADRLLKANVTMGTLVVSPRSNVVAISQGTRTGTKDLNRSFPGSLQGSNEDKLAAEIFQVIQDKGTSVVLTYHASDGYHLDNPAQYGQTIIFDAAETRAMADEVAARINAEITVPVEKYSVFIEPIATSATYEIYYRLHIPAYGLEVATPIGQTKCMDYHLRLTRLFCEKVGVEVSNWDEILGTSIK